MMLLADEVIEQDGDGGKANGSRERAPDDKLRVPTIHKINEQNLARHARACPGHPRLG